MMKKEKKCLVVYSGGLDSTVLLHHCKKEFKQVTAVNFFYGSNHNEKEQAMAKINCEKLGIKLLEINLDFMEKFFESSLLSGASEIPEGHYEEASMKSTVVPFRNGIMLSIASGIAESHNIEYLALGAHSGDHAIYPDCTTGFFQALQKALNAGSYNAPQLYIPFSERDKGGIVAEGLHLGVDFTETWTCYKGQELACGVCGSCVERKEAFELNGFSDPIKYQGV